jgi:hypothetical protein
MRVHIVQDPVKALLAPFETAAGMAGQAEAAVRKQMQAEIARLERERAFAYRRLNFMRLLSEGIRSAENEEAAVAGGRATVRARLGWESDSETRIETLSRLAPVTRAAFSCLTCAAADSPIDEVEKALGDFEVWYMARFERAFWSLFDQHVEELPLVER